MKEKTKEIKKAIKSLHELKELFLSYPEEFDSKELLINKRIDLIEKILKERLQQTEFKVN